MRTSLLISNVTIERKLKTVREDINAHTQNTYNREKDTPANREVDGKPVTSGGDTIVDVHALQQSY